MWSVQNFANGLKERVTRQYITNKKQTIVGSFFDKTTQDAALNVRLIIIDSTNINVKFLNLTDISIVKKIYYKGVVQDQTGKRYKINGVKINDRISFLKHSEIIHNVLSKGGKVRFFLYGSKKSNFSTEYYFNIFEAKGYRQAYQKLKLK